MIPVRASDLRARRYPAAVLWLLTWLLPDVAMAQRRMPEPLQPQPPPLELSEPGLLPLATPSVPAAAVRPARDQGSTASSPVPPAAAKVSTGLVTIESDLQRADQATGVVTSIGNVRIVYPDQRVVATARQAQYFSKEGRVVLSGDVDIVQEDGNLLRAEQVIYLVNSQRLQAIPPTGRQVFAQVRIKPRTTGPASPAVQPSVTGPSQ